MKVAIVHDQLREFGGAERVLVALKRIFPSAVVYTTTYDPGSLGPIAAAVSKWDIRVSWFGRIPFINRYYSPFRFLTPQIWESFDLTGYDLVISSSGSWMSKGVVTEKPTVHFSYIHHPPRYLYGYETAVEWQRYFSVRLYARIVNHYLRIWDFKSSQRPDHLIANSIETRRRIEKFYRRDAKVIYPPVTLPEVSFYRPGPDSYYLTVSRLAKAKHVEVLIRTANQRKLKLRIVGGGRDGAYLRSIAGPTVSFLGNVGDGEFNRLFTGAKAFLFASKDEEFGIAVAEALGYGLPVIAFASGGVPELVQDGVNGFLYHKLDPGELGVKIGEFEKLDKKQLATMSREARRTAERFSEEKFAKEIKSFIENKVKNYAR